MTEQTRSQRLTAAGFTRRRTGKSAGGLMRDPEDDSMTTKRSEMLHSAQWILYEHEDGRYAAAPEGGACFAAGEPKWHRVGPVAVHAMAQPVEVADMRKQFDELLEALRTIRDLDANLYDVFDAKAAARDAIAKANRQGEDVTQKSRSSMDLDDLMRAALDKRNVWDSDNEPMTREQVARLVGLVLEEAAKACEDKEKT